jgi:hypothetical protein
MSGACGKRVGEVLKLKTHSRKLEADCLWDYRKTRRFIDLPPLNFSGGKAD